MALSDRSKARRAGRTFLTPSTGSARPKMDYLFNPNYVLSNACIYGYDPDFNVREFLESIHSPLLDWKGANGATADALVTHVCRENDIDVRIVLTLMEREQSLLSKKGTQSAYDFAMGYGCSDNRKGVNRFKGFANQVSAATRRLHDYEGQYENQIDIRFTVDAPLSDKNGRRYVKPVNMATLAMYLYCPWVGDRAFEGMKPPYGNLYLHDCWVRYFGNPCP